MLARSCIDYNVSFIIHSQHRLLLIDTPLHNTLMELWTMVHFLIPGISRPYLDFPVKAANEENQDYCHKLVIRLHRVRCHFFHLPSVEAVRDGKKK